MLAAGDRLEEFKFYFPLDLILAKICSPDLDLIESVATAFSPLDLALVNGRVLTQRDVAVDDEEAETGFIELSDGVEHDDFAVGRGCLLLC